MKVFISHKSDDKLVANELHKRLGRIGGIDVWVDIFELNAGDSLSEIEESVVGSDAVIVLWSSSTDASDWVRTEIETGSRSQKRIIPCVLDPSLPQSNPILADRLYIDLSEPDLGVGHLCLSYVLPTALALAGHDDRISILRRYEGYVSYCIRDLIVQGKNRHQAAYWRQELIDSFDELAAWLDGMIADPATDPDLRRTLDGASPVIVPMHLQLLEILDRLVEESLELDDDAGTDEGSGDEFDGLDLLMDHDPADALDNLEMYLGYFPPTVEVDEPVELLYSYITDCITSLARLITLKNETGNDDVRRVVEHLITYLQNTDDLLAEGDLGFAGLLDDAWMIHNVAYRVMEFGALDPEDPSTDWERITWTDEVVRGVLPDDVLPDLEHYLVQLIGILFSGVDDYDPAYVYDENDVARFFMPRPERDAGRRSLLRPWRRR